MSSLNDLGQDISDAILQTNPVVHADPNRIAYAYYINKHTAIIKFHGKRDCVTLKPLEPIRFHVVDRSTNKIVSSHATHTEAEQAAYAR